MMLVITLICLLKIEWLKLRFNILGGIVVRTTIAIEMITTMLAVCSTPLNNHNWRLDREQHKYEK